MGCIGKNSVWLTVFAVSVGATALAPGGELAAQRTEGAALSVKSTTMTASEAKSTTVQKAYRTILTAWLLGGDPLGFLMFTR